MKITLKDGSFKEYENSKSVIEIAADISEGLARVATAGDLKIKKRPFLHILQKGARSYSRFHPV